MGDESNLFPLLLLIGGGVSSFALAVAIAASFFTGGPKGNECLWFAIASVVAVLGWYELRGAH